MIYLAYHNHPRPIFTDQPGKMIIFTTNIKQPQQRIPIN